MHSSVYQNIFRWLFKSFIKNSLLFRNNLLVLIITLIKCKTVLRFCIRKRCDMKIESWLEKREWTSQIEKKEIDIWAKTEVDATNINDQTSLAEVGWLTTGLLIWVIGAVCFFITFPTDIYAHSRTASELKWCASS